MEERRRLSASARNPDDSAGHWHSTPVKKKNVAASLDAVQTSGLTSFHMDNTGEQWSRGSPPVPADSQHPPSFLESQFPVSDLSGSTVQRQRRELQLLMAELKDRERELNTMTASHLKQHHAWEQDRQRVLTLEQRCARTEEELQKRNEVIRVLTKRVCVVETREKEVQKELSATKRQLSELEEKQAHVNNRCQDFEEKNQSLSSTLMALSTQLGSLQVREEELSSMLKLKDKDVTEASQQVLDLSERLRDLEATLTESRSRENKLLRDSKENKRWYKEARQEATQLREDLEQQVAQSSAQREEVIRLKQELQLLRRDLVLTEGDSWKDELLELSRSKQERIMSELSCLRQVCENQRNDLQLLRLNQESTRDTLRERSSHLDELTCNCVDRRSASSPRGKNVGRHSFSPPAADLHGSGSEELGVLPAPLTDGDGRQSGCSLQQLLDESRLEDHSLRHHSSSQTSAPLYFHKCLTPDLQHHPSTSVLQNSVTPPSACPPTRRQTHRLMDSWT
ncbi:coiled-coil domain-containing protein 62 isoform X2 [Parambassis ranga]|uniref:Coiled-coil domain-containing protein 62 isoform X2 n=1 Tax=Parambassis ranga TaxID=210632 RepID=A0A6P7JAK3_9TELE|nr:coiled-coil domain-containing protein 62 isoform X2 [Parambassis ranga]